MARKLETCWAVVCEGVGIIHPTLAITRRDALNQFGGKEHLKELPQYSVQKFELRPQ